MTNSEKTITVRFKCFNECLTTVEEFQNFEKNFSRNEYHNIIFKCLVLLRHAPIKIRSKYMEFFDCSPDNVYSDEPYITIPEMTKKGWINLEKSLKNDLAGLSKKIEPVKIFYSTLQM